MLAVRAINACVDQSTGRKSDQRSVGVSRTNDATARLSSHVAKRWGGVFWVRECRIHRAGSG